MTTHRPAMQLLLGPGVFPRDIIAALKSAGLPILLDRAELVVVRVPDHIRQPEPAHEH